MNVKSDCVAKKLPNYFVGVYAYLRCILRQYGVPYVRLIPQNSESHMLAYLRALHLRLFEVLLRSLICLTINLNDFLQVHQK